MRTTLATVTWTVGVVAFLWVLGRLKMLYYFGAFGVGLGSLELTPIKFWFESWFVAQNTVFVAMLCWLALKTRIRWVAGLALLHALIPLAAHYAFAFHGSAAAELLIDYRHTLLKLLPFAGLAAVWLFRPGQRRELASLRSPLSPAGSVLFVIVLASWSISTAKHFGSFDANLAMRDPSAHLTRVRLAPGSGIPAAANEYFLLHANRDTLLLWDTGAFVYGESTELRTLAVSRSTVEWVEATRRFAVQPGGRFL